MEYSLVEINHTMICAQPGSLFFVNRSNYGYYAYSEIGALCDFIHYLIFWKMDFRDK